MGMGIMEVYCKFHADIYSQADIRFSQTPNSTGASNSVPTT